MTHPRKQLELLAPAKNADIGIEAVNHGADAIYIGGPAFGARANAENSVADIERLIRHAHRFGARVFVTCNTILHDEEVASARLRWRQANGETLFRAERRESFDDYTPLQLTQRLRIDDRLSIDLGLGNALPSPESVALRVAGMKRQATLSLNYMPTRVDQIQIEHRRENYRLQNGEALGNGRHTGISYSHALRQETPDLQAGAFWSIHRFDRQALSDSGQLVRFHRDYLPAEQKLLYPKVTNLPDNYFVPDNFHFYGLRLSTNTRFEQDYTRAWRPGVFSVR